MELDWICVLLVTRMFCVIWVNLTKQNTVQFLLFEQKMINQKYSTTANHPNKTENSFPLL